MSRSGYNEDCEGVQLWRGAVERAIKGKRGQAFLRELLAALDALPEQKLARGSFVKGGICALGAVAVARGIDVSALEPVDEFEYVNRDAASEIFGIAPAMVAEIMYENDEGDYHPDGNEAVRFWRVRTWVLSQIRV